MFSYEFSENFQNFYTLGNLWTVASVSIYLSTEKIPKTKWLPWNF